MKNYYTILGVDVSASQEQIKSAYIYKAKKYHPDVYRGDKVFAENKMFELNNAYNTLKDVELKAEYDKKLKLNKNNKPTKKNANDEFVKNRNINKNNNKEKISFKQKFKTFFSDIKTNFLNNFKMLDEDGHPVSQEEKDKRMLRLFIMFVLLGIGALLFILFKIA